MSEQKEKKGIWEPWHEEVKRYKAKQTEGLTRDMEALEAHIRKLREICPKDVAGWPHGTALSYLNRLQIDLDTARKYLAGATA